MRRWLSFPCQGVMIAGAVDEALGSTGLLIVSGGNEIASGAHGGMASLAAQLCQLGYPVFRYDRRGVGDSGGINNGFESSRDDIAAALAAFRSEAPELERIVAFGNCDGATSLGLFEADLRLDGIVLANPWTIEGGQSDTPAPAAIVARYRDKLTNPSEWLRLLRGGVDLRKLFKGLRTLSRKPQANDLASRLRSALADSRTPLTLILATRDATCQAFSSHFRGQQWTPIRARATIVEIDSASHSFAGQGDEGSLLEALIAALES